MNLRRQRDLPPRLLLLLQFPRPVYQLAVGVKVNLGSPRQRQTKVWTDVFPGKQKEETHHMALGEL